MIKWLKQMLLLNAVLLPPMLLIPALCLLPIFAAHPDPGWGQACFWFGPLSAAFWTLVYSQWSSARAWQRMGRLHEWRRDHGGLLVTVMKATPWMFLADICEMASTDESPDSFRDFLVISASPKMLADYFRSGLCSAFTYRPLDILQFFCGVRYRQTRTLEQVVRTRRLPE